MPLYRIEWSARLRGSTVVDADTLTDAFAKVLLNGCETADGDVVDYEILSGYAEDNPEQENN